MMIFFGELERLETTSTTTETTWNGALALKRPAQAKSGSGNFSTLELTALNSGTTRISLSSMFSDIDGNILADHSLYYYLTVNDFLRILGLVTYQSRSQHDNINISLDDISIAITDVNGDFAFGVESGPGTYTVKADAEGFLPVEKPVNLTLAGDADSGTVILAGGDCNDDDTIDIGDLTQLLGVYRNTGVTNTSDAVTDVNADTQVNIQDLTVLGSNYGLSGLQSWP